MTKTQLKKAMDRLGYKSTNASIADLFGINEQAVQAWGDKVPELRRFHIQRDHPKIYAAIGGKK